MATASNSPPAPIKSQNSPRSRHSRIVSASRGVQTLSEASFPSPPASSNADQEQYVTPSFSTPSDSFSPGEVEISVASVDGLVIEDGSAFSAPADFHPENSENGGATKKQAWNKPSNGANAEVGAVMGAESWPALSKTVRASPKASSPDSIKSHSHAFPTSSQGIPIGSLSSPKGTNTGMPALNSTSNHAAPARQRSMKRGGGGGGGGGGLSHGSMTSNGSLSLTPLIQDFVVEASPSNQGKSSSNSGESPRDNLHKDSGQRGGPHSGNDLHHQRGPIRRTNSGPQPRGDGSFHHTHGRRDQERGKQDWNSSHRPLGSREGLTTQQRVGSRPFVRGPISSTPFISAPPIAVPPFIPPMVYNEMPSPVFYPPRLHPDSVRYLPMFPFAPMFYPVYDAHLSSKILTQIDYYFSSENLVKDTFLRQNMDGDGWVPITLIANFKKMMELTDNIQLILDTVQASYIVEVQGDKVRRKMDWNKWIMPPVMYSPGANPQSIHTSDQDILTPHVQNVSLNKKETT